MDDTMLTVKFIEVMIMQVLVIGGVLAIVIAAVSDIVHAMIEESRRADQIA